MEALTLTRNHAFDADGNISLKTHHGHSTKTTVQTLHKNL